MAATINAFTTTDLSRRARKVIDAARADARNGALVRDGDGTLLRISVARHLDEHETVRRYVDMLAPLLVRGVEGSSPADFPGAGWLVHLPASSRTEFVHGAVERLMLALDGQGFAELDRWFEEWRQDAQLERAGVFERIREPADDYVTARPRLQRQ